MIQNKTNTVIGGNLYSSEKAPNVDYKYGPFNSPEEALKILGGNRISDIEGWSRGLNAITPGLKFGVTEEDGTITEYEFTDSTGTYVKTGRAAIGDIKEAIGDIDSLGTDDSSNLNNTDSIVDSILELSKIVGDTSELDNSLQEGESSTTTLISAINKAATLGPSGGGGGNYTTPISNPDDDTIIGGKDGYITLYNIKEYLEDEYAPVWTDATCVISYTKEGWSNSDHPSFDFG